MDAVDIGKFRALQAKLHLLWPTMTPRSGRQDRTVVICHSVNVDVPLHLQPVVPSYEERFLCLVLTLLRQPGARVIQVTSQPMLPRLVDYYFGLVPELDTPEVRQRFFAVSVGDGGPGRLVDKILMRPQLVKRIRSLIPDRDRAFIVPYNVTLREQELAVRLGIPVYGPDPLLAEWGTKTGGRRLFREEGIPHPAGVEDISTIGEVVKAIGTIRSERPHIRQVIVKLNDRAGGLGNGVVDVAGASDEESLGTRIRMIQLDDPDGSRNRFLADLERDRGIVEERIIGEEFRSPSAQARISPTGDVEVLSTHDQTLGGATGQTFLGCRFPADPAYGPIIYTHAMSIARRLSREGVVGRFGIDFVVVRSPGRMWEPYAIEINLRSGGTTHPMLTLQALTDGEFDAEAGVFRAPDGRPKHYVASDHVESPAFATLTPDDVLDLVTERGLAWKAETLTGMVFHMVSAVAVAGRLGVTAIGDSAEHSDRLYRRAWDVLREETNPH